MNQYRLLIWGIAAILVGIPLFGYLAGPMGAVAWILFCGGVLFGARGFGDALVNQVRGYGRFHARIGMDSAMARVRENDPRAAVEVLKRLLAEDANDPIVREKLADVFWERLRDGPAALPHYRHLSKTAPAKARSRAAHRAADILQSLDRAAEARLTLLDFAANAEGSEAQDAVERAARL